MRVIGYHDHPTLKISIFATDTRFPVQFEIVGYTQIFKFRKGGPLETLADVKQLLDKEFCDAVAANMLRMKQQENQLWQRWEGKYGKEDEDLPAII